MRKLRHQTFRQTWQISSVHIDSKKRMRMHTLAREDAQKTILSQIDRYLQYGLVDDRWGMYHAGCLKSYPDFEIVDIEDWSVGANSDDENSEVVRIWFLA